MTDSSIKQMTLQAEYKTEIAMYSVLGSINGVAYLQCTGGSHDVTLVSLWLPPVHCSTGGNTFPYKMYI
jgi:hypothetical protein